MIKVGQCKVCGANVPQDGDGVLYPHKELNSPTEYCYNRDPDPGEYPVGFDSEPRWIMNGGLPTLGKDHR